MICQLKELTGDDYCQLHYKSGQCQTCIIAEYGEPCMIEIYYSMSVSLTEYVEHLNTCPKCIKNSQIVSQIQKQ